MQRYHEERSARSKGARLSPLERLSSVASQSRRQKVASFLSLSFLLGSYA